MSIDTIGDTSASGGAWQGFVRLWQITASAPGALSSVGIDVNGVGAGSNVRTAIYTDIANVAGTLLGESADSVAVAGWNDLAITGVAILAGTKYWIGFQAQNSNLNLFRSSAGGAAVYYHSQSYGSFPASVTWDQLTNQNIINLRMTYATPTTGDLFIQV